MSKWIQHIKQYAKENNMSYGCALSDPKCREAYQKSKEVKITSKIIRRAKAEPEAEQVLTTLEAEPVRVKSGSGKAKLAKEEKEKEDAMKALNINLDSMPSMSNRELKMLNKEVAKEKTKLQPKTKAEPKAEPKAKQDKYIRPVESKDNIIKNLVLELDDDSTYPILALQSKLLDSMFQKLENLQSKKNKVVVADLYFDKDAKHILNKMVEYWGEKEGYINALNRIENATRNIAEYQGIDKSQFIPITKDTYNLYIKRLNQNLQKKVYDSIKNMK